MSADPVTATDVTTASDPSVRADVPFVHEALLYRDPDELANGVRAFVQEARRAAEPVLVVLPDTSLEWLAPTLGDGTPGVRFEDMRRVGRNPSCLMPLFERWLDEHHDRARVVSEPIWPGRRYAETAECLRHEALLNVALARAGSSILCPYAAAQLDAEVLAGAELTHRRLRDGTGGTRTSERYVDGADATLVRRWPQHEPTGSVAEYPFDGDLHRLRRAVAADARLLALDGDRRDDLVFAINEAATNVTRHADGRCTVRIWSQDDTVVAELRSAGPLGDPLAGRRHPPIGAPSGRGLWLINQLCDLAELRSDETHTTLRMHVLGGSERIADAERG